jgi:WD40 repeat protein
MCRRRHPATPPAALPGQPHLWRWGLLGLLAGLVLAPGLNAFPGIGGAVTRAQSQAIGNAIRKNVSLVVRPRLRVARGATGPVTALALSQNEKSLVTAVGDHSVRVWDLDAGREAARLRGLGANVDTLTVSPDGAYAFAMDRSGTARLWDLARPDPPARLPAGFPRQPGPAAFVRDDRRLLLVTGGDDGQLSLWAVPDLHFVDRIRTGTGPVTRLAAGLPDSALVVARGRDGRAAVLDLSGRQPRRELAGATGTGPLALDRERVALADAAGNIGLWSLADGRRLSAWSGAGPVRALASSARGGLVASGGDDGRIRLWSRRDGRLQRELTGHEGGVAFLQFSQDGALLLSASADGTTRVWQTRSGQLAVTLISTAEGWAVVDAYGRFDGNEAAVNGIEWAAEQQVMTLDSFSPGYYQAGLLPTTLQHPQRLASVRSVTGDGIHLPPEVEFASAIPARGAAGELEVRLVVRDNGSGVEELRLFHNGKRIPGPGQPLADAGTDAALARTYQVQLSPGENLFSAVAVSREGIESAPVTARMAVPGDTRRPSLHVLLVGVNRYRERHLQLRYPVPDASAIGQDLRQRGRGLFAEVRVTELFDQDASREGILQALRQLQGVSPRDLAVVYLAGHGTTVAGEWYFIPQDIGAPTPARIQARGLPSALLTRELEDIAPQRVLLLIDACDSGLALNPVRDFGGLRSLRLLARSVGLHILAATDRDQYALEIDALAHGVFTYAVLEALGGQADTAPRDGRLGVRELMGFVEESVPRLSRRYAKYAQYPSRHSRGTDFPLGTVSGR